MSKILLTGASGYIGGHFKDKLKKEHEIIAISRNISNKDNEQNVTWKAADLFDLGEITKVMEGIDTAIYLVHSMMPSAKLTQANFENMDALLADNFARAAKQQGVKHIVFMSGLIPNVDRFSAHLRSRLECEKILGDYGIPVSTLCAGLIIGAKGSSYPILKRLVERLPAMILPSWAYNKIAPVAIEDVINGLVAMVDRSPTENEAIDISGPETMNYKELILRTAQVLDKPLPMLDLPIIPIIVSRYWVQLISNVPKEMVYPLMNSLIHNMVPHEQRIVPEISMGRITFEDSVQRALDEEQNVAKKKEGPSAHRSSSAKAKHQEIKDVRAITRFDIPEGYTMNDVTKEYAKFINNITLHLVKGTMNEQEFNMNLPLINKFILKMQRDERDSTDEMVVYRIVGGDLAHANNGGNARFEFRRIRNTNEGIIALQEYEPTLPWIVYKFTQAKAHKMVMNIFKNKMAHLALKESESGRRRKSKNIFIGVSVVGATVTAGLIGLKRIKRNQIKKHSMSNAEL
ncbi:NAD(P)H-binding protein [Staphylococcus saccharolyticus]|uniref:NAD(P)H-binding protein n=1 Tax=Staphylococcus saccharolyticus TaxID=33028 RepID=UPI001934201F|nr:NAD(P)H-binding protein [Staphylococcus saccharolyticus]MBL7584384.1 NAD(P)H-binding protein [Staphylococcus saccharolyticus]